MATLKRGLSLYGLTMIAIGSCIGSGIFATPGTIANDVHSPFTILLVWFIGGLIGLTGALTYSEVGAMYPETGGIYSFLKNAYGELFGFLFGWTTILVVNTGSIAALCLVFAYYTSFFFPMGPTAQIILAICAIIFITIVNIFGIKLAELFSNIFTGLKILGIIILIIIGVSLGSADINGMAFNFDFIGNTGDDSISMIGLALIGVVFSYGGFQHASYVASEVKNVQRNLPLAMIIGIIIVAVVYVLANVAYLGLLPVETIASSKKVAADAVETVIPGGGTLIAVIIAISTLGTALIYTISAPRIYYAMASDGLFFKKLAEIHPTYRTPVYAIISQSAWAIILLLFWGTFSDLITYVVFTDWIFLTLAGISIFVFRKTQPNRERPYKAFGYPFIPLIFISISLFIVFNTLIEKPIHAIYGLLITAIGIPLFMYFRKGRDNG